MEEPAIVLTAHEQRIRTLEREMAAMKAVQSEIRAMHETLVLLATELKHTNEHLSRHETKLDEIEHAPALRLRQIVTAVIAALSGSLISVLLARLLGS